MEKEMLIANGSKDGPEAAIETAATIEADDIDFLNEDEENDPMADMSDTEQIKSKRNSNSHAKSGNDDDDIEEEHVEYEVEEDAEQDEENNNEEEQLEDEDDTADDSEKAASSRKPSQLPKKRKDARADEESESANAEPPAKAKKGKLSTSAENMQDDGYEAENEQPTSSARAKAELDSKVDEHQCRVCTTKQDLVSLFKVMDDKKQTVADWLMIICPAVSIALRDFMPQYICNSCVDNVTVAMQLKTQCENTEKELRKKLSRSKNKVRRPRGYVVIDAPLESDPASEEEELKDDAEFKVSDVEQSPSVDEDSDDSDYGGPASAKKKRASTGGRGRGRRKSAPSNLANAKPKQKLAKEPKKRGRPARRSVVELDNSSDEDPFKEDSSPSKKPKKSLNGKADVEEKPTIYECDECDQTYTRKLSLILHKKSHDGGRELISCEICGKQFKIKGAYRTHLEKHKEDGDTPGKFAQVTVVTHACTKCKKILGSKSELRRHLADVHKEQMPTLECDKCKKQFVSEKRFAQHKEGRCPGHEVKHRSKDYESYTAGKDLFKTVAPLTTTYWSDSFSD